MRLFGLTRLEEKKKHKSVQTLTNVIENGVVNRRTSLVATVRATETHDTIEEQKVRGQQKPYDTPASRKLTLRLLMVPKRGFAYVC